MLQRGTCSSATKKGRLSLIIAIHKIVVQIRGFNFERMKEIA